MGLTTDKHDGCLHEIDENGMQRCYLVLPDGERRNLVRPVRRTYRHVGTRPQSDTRELTPEEHERYDKIGYVAFEQYPPDSGALGRYWTQAQLQSGCGTTTTMGQAIAETYAASPSFYGGTMCVHCKTHFPVGEHGEFVWEDGEGSRVGT